MVYKFDDEVGIIYFMHNSLIKLFIIIDFQ